MIFIDTGPILAQHHALDQHHAAAKEAFRQLVERRERCFTSNLVLSEAFTLMGRRLSYGYAAQAARHILSSRSLTILRPDQADDMEAVRLLEKYADQRVGFADCISFILMVKSRIRRAFSFDRHFERAGFELWP